MQMEPSTRRAMLGRLGGLLAGLALFLAPGALRAAVETPRAAEGPARRPAAPQARPPRHAVKRHG